MSTNNIIAGAIPHTKQISELVKDLWCDVLDRIEAIGDLPVRTLRIMADDLSESRHYTRGKSIAEIIDMEFGDRLSDLLEKMQE